jgi:hypothetical protein
VIDFKRIQENSGGNFNIVGLYHYVSSNSHNRALKIIAPTLKTGLLLVR